ncbi:MAG: TIGR04211 family SH3 domain-containing protein [Gammaproteobacteria bacterium SHHR-1]|uniref:TIGR04211 family SH3 domain-containing protein n=1 Tax=Magnetovirga frankeli TaxID=947516 RepID=UPI00129349F4|nr:TIGR04211 family SH3 domain-containing protein [gamma proteobacterium SS-5]
MRFLPWTLLLLFALCDLQAAFITDQIRVGLYPEPNTQGKPLKVLRSGEEIRLLEQQGSFYRVELKDGSTGWIGRQYLSEEEPAVRSLLTSRKELAQVRMELEQARQELNTLQQELSQGNEENILKEALAAANLKVKELEQRLQQRLNLGKEGQPSCEQTLDKMEAKQLQCQVRLARLTQEEQEGLAAENERLREVMQQAAKLLDLPPSGEVPVLIPASAFTTTRIIPRPPPPPVEPERPASSAQPEASTEQVLPVWIYLVLALTLLTGIIAGFALFDFRSRYRYNVRL